MHSDLIAKLEALDGPDREVDLKLTAKFFGRREADLHRSYGLRCYDFTDSLDATVALVERVLPGWSWEARKSGSGNGQASVWDPMDQPRPGTTIRADHKSSPAIALLIATLRALEARDG